MSKPGEEQDFMGEALAEAGLTLKSEAGDGNDGGAGGNGNADPGSGSGSGGKAVVIAPEIKELFVGKLGERFTVDSFNDLVPIVERGLKVTDEDANGIEDLRKVKIRAAELETEVAQLKSKPDFDVNPDVYRMTKVAELYPDRVKIFQSVINLGSPDKLDLVKASIIAENPRLKDNPDAVQRLVERRYPELFNENANPEDQAYKDAKFDMELAADNYADSIKKEYEAIALPQKPAPPPDKTAEIQALKTEWTGKQTEVDGMITGNIGVQYFADDAQKELSGFEIEVPKEVMGKYYSRAIDYAASKGLKPDKTGMESIKKFATNLYIAENLAAYNTKIAQHISEQKDIQWRQKTNNHSAGRMGSPPPGQPPKGKGLDTVDGVFNDIMNRS